MANQLYTIDRVDPNYLERVWSFAQYNNLYMYKTRITSSIIAWVIELPPGAVTTRYILEFGDNSTNVMGTYYC